MRFLILCLLALPLAALAAAQNDLSCDLMVLSFPWGSLEEYQPGMYLTDFFMFQAPYQVVGVCADREGVTLAIRRVWIQRFEYVRFLFAVGGQRFSRFWELLAVGIRVDPRGRAEIVTAWDVSPDPPDVPDADTGEVRRRP